MAEINETQEESKKVLKKKVAHAKKVAAKKAGRVFQESRQIFSDLFKLQVSKMIRNVSWNKIPDLKEVEHVHFFHTYDSTGKKQDSCVPTGGHFHVIEWEDKGDAEPPQIKSVSGPKKWGIETDDFTGKRKRVPVPNNKWDEHTHSIDYLQSNEVQVRTTNVEAAKVIGKNANLTAKPGWVK